MSGSNSENPISRRRAVALARAEAGFSDSAHFSRTFRRMFGIAAAMLEIV
jgi:AraC-like DNA-binding protein